MKENLAALDIKLSADDVQEVRRIAAEADAVQGERYPPEGAALLFVDTPPLKQ